MFPGIAYNVQKRSSVQQIWTKNRRGSGAYMGMSISMRDNLFGSRACAWDKDGCGRTFINKDVNIYKRANTISDTRFSPALSDPIHLRVKCPLSPARISR